MDCYIVRIYRRDRRRRQALVGVVEEVGYEGRLAFSTADELLRILTTRRRRSSRKGRVAHVELTPWSVAPGTPDDPRAGARRAGA